MSKNKPVRKTDELREEFAQDFLDVFSAWIHDKILVRLSTFWLWASVAGMFVFEQILNLTFVDHAMLAFDEYLLGTAIAVVFNELRHRRKVRKQIEADKVKELEQQDESTEEEGRTPEVKLVSSG